MKFQKKVKDNIKLISRKGGLEHGNVIQMAQQRVIFNGATDV
jgi:hypothetical protein